MSFRLRLFSAFVLAVLVPMGLLSLVVRREMTRRITAQYELRADGALARAEEETRRTGASVKRSLQVVKKAARDDNALRRAVVDGDPSRRRYLLDYASEVMPLVGLTMLQIQDEEGRILSSGHFRNEYDILDPVLPRLLASAPGGVALVRARAPGGSFLALASVDSLLLGGKKLRIVGGVGLGRRFLAGLVRGEGASVSLSYPGGMIPPTGGGTSATGMGRSTVPEVRRALTVPFADPNGEGLAAATLLISHPLSELHDLERSVGRWFLLLVLATCVLALIMAVSLSSTVSRPIVELAAKTKRVEIDGLDVDFSSKRKDEIGDLSRVLQSMTERLRAGAALLREAERRATLGEIARQVNHDIKNGLTPLRNVLRHLFETARTSPAELPRILEERRDTLESGLSYLEELASNYARLGERAERRPCDVGSIVGRVTRGIHAPEGIEVTSEIEGSPVMMGDPVALRRIVENLVRNAIESIEGGEGRVLVRAAVLPAAEGLGEVMIEVKDTGRGMGAEELGRIFDDFFTTKDGGTGLGLSIVRRLVLDMGGRIQAESEGGRGSRFVVYFPQADEPPERPLGPGETPVG